MENDPNSLSYKDLFLKLAKPNSKGFSRKVPVTEFVGIYARLATNNGGSWSRDDGPLGKMYNVIRHKEGKGVAITHVELQGRKKMKKERRISGKIRKEVGKRKCAVLCVSIVEVDHKDGRYDDPSVSDLNKQKADDFQALSKCVNNAKRQHCKVCKKTGNRFDAKKLGYRVSQVLGNGEYRGTCVGCYWYDPSEFNSSLDLAEKL